MIFRIIFCLLGFFLFFFSPDAVIESARRNLPALLIQLRRRNNSMSAREPK